MFMKKFGITKDLKDVNYYIIGNDNLKLKVLDYGATIQSLHVKSKTGELVDVVLGYDDIESYEENNCFFGSIIGRYGNRIAKGKYTLNGKEYSLAINNGENHLHGGNKGFDRCIWEVTQVAEDSITLYKFSCDKEEGYNGNLKVYVKYTVTDDCKLEIDYKAISDDDTPLSLTNHTYFNLNGNGSAIEQNLMIKADKFLENDDGCLPTGEFLDVKGTAFDFNQSKPINKNIFDNETQLKKGNGYDHNFCVGEEGVLKHIATLDGNDFSMKAYTTEPGMQFYSGNSIYKHLGKNKMVYDKHFGICLETQKYPNSPNEPKFPNCILKKDTWYNTKTIYEFISK